MGRVGSVFWPELIPVRKIKQQVRANTAAKQRGMRLRRRSIIKTLFEELVVAGFSDRSARSCIRAFVQEVWGSILAILRSMMLDLFVFKLTI